MIEKKKKTLTMFSKANKMDSNGLIWVTLNCLHRVNLKKICLKNEEIVQLNFFFSEKNNHFLFWLKSQFTLVSTLPRGSIS